MRSMIQRASDTPRRGRTPPAIPWRWLGLFGIAAAMRAVAALTGLVSLAPDPRLEIAARHLAAGHGLALGLPSAPVPTAALPPVAPALLAMMLRVFHGHPLALPTLAIVLGAVGALAAARLATGLHGPTAGRAAGWAVAMSPLLVGGAVLGPATFALLLLFALTASAEWLRTPRRVRAMSAGVLWGLCALAGAVGLLLPPVVMAWAWRPLGLTLPPRERLVQTGLLALGLVATVAPWAIRNAIVVRAPVAITTSSGLELLSADNPIVWNDPARRGGTIDVLEVEPYASRLGRLTEPERDARARSEAFAFLAGRTGRDVAAVAGARLARLAGPGPSPDERRAAGGAAGGRVLVVVVAVWEAVWLLSAAWGALRTLSGPRRWFQSLPLAALVVLAAAAIAVSVSWSARLGFEPLVAMLAGVGALHARRAMHLRRRGLRVVTGGARAGRGS
jgi:hypothetical protein